MDDRGMIRTFVSPKMPTDKGSSPSFDCAHSPRQASTESTPKPSLLGIFALPLPFTFTDGSGPAGRKALADRNSSVGCCVRRCDTQASTDSRGQVSTAFFINKLLMNAIDEERLYLFCSRQIVSVCQVSSQPTPPGVRFGMKEDPERLELE